MYFERIYVEKNDVKKEGFLLWFFIVLSTHWKVVNLTIVEGNDYVLLVNCLKAE